MTLKFDNDIIDAFHFSHQWRVICVTINSEIFINFNSVLREIFEIPFLKLFLKKKSKKKRSRSNRNILHETLVSNGQFSYECISNIGLRQFGIFYIQRSSVDSGFPRSSTRPRHRCVVSHDDFELLIASVRSVEVPDTSGNCPVVDSHLQTTQNQHPSAELDERTVSGLQLRAWKARSDKSLISIDKLFR